MILHNQQGFSLIGVITALGLGLAFFAATTQQMQQRSEQIKILLMEHRLEMEEQKVQRAAKSLLAMTVSAKKLKKSHPLYKCIKENKCRSQSPYPFTLRGAGSEAISGLKDFQGRLCTQNCPIEVTTAFQVDCGAQTFCSSPLAITTTYEVKQNSTQIFHGRHFKPRIGTAPLAVFMCPDNQYIVSKNAEGGFSCDYARISVEARQCPEGQSAYGIDKNGFLKCRPVTNFCNQSIGATVVLDTSGSMKTQGKLKSAITVARKFNNKLRSSDQAGFAAFNHSLVKQLPINQNKRAINSNLGRLRANGRTNMSAGLQSAFKTLEKFDNGSKVIIFLSDGFHNVGPPPIEVAKEIKKAGFRIFSIGFGKRPDHNVLGQIASSRADYFYANDNSALNTVFGRIRGTLCRGG